VEPKCEGPPEDKETAASLHGLLYMSEFVFVKFNFAMAYSVRTYPQGYTLSAPYTS
jgi:hypothetical protein